MLVFPPQGHLVLQGEKDSGGFHVDKLATASGILWQPEPASLCPVTAATPPSPPDSQSCTPSSWWGTKTAHDAGSGAFPALLAPGAMARISPGHCDDELRVLAGQAARPGRQRVPFPSTNCLSTALGRGAKVHVPKEAVALSPASSGKADKGGYTTGIVRQQRGQTLPPPQRGLEGSCPSPVRWHRPQLVLAAAALGGRAPA